MTLGYSEMPNVITRKLIRERRKQEGEKRCEDESRGQRVKIAALHGKYIQWNITQP